MNFEPKGHTCCSPRRVLREWKAHCVEGAIFAAAALRFHGHPPLLMDLTSEADDYDHVVTLFRQRGFWGAISKTNHAVLRYRDPIYRTLRELALSYFHEYFLDDGRKTLRSFAAPIDLSRFARRRWMTAEDDLWDVYDHLFAAKHHPLLTPAQMRSLRRADPVERRAGKLVTWKKTR